MLESVRTFQHFSGLLATREIIKYCVEAMERGVLDVDAENRYGNTFGVVLVRCGCKEEYWLRYWALEAQRCQILEKFCSK